MKPGLTVEELAQHVKPAMMEIKIRTKPELTAVEKLVKHVRVSTFIMCLFNHYYT